MIVVNVVPVCVALHLYILGVVAKDVVVNLIVGGILEEYPRACIVAKRVVGDLVVA